MNYLRIVALLCCFTTALHAQLPAKEPAKVKTVADLRDLLLTNKWSWRNVSAGVPDRECVFMPDGTFRHPNFIAKYNIKDTHTVELTRKPEKGKVGNERAVMTFSPDYMSFECIDFDQRRRITGVRLPK
jgi:hypothetical protein